MNNKKPAIVICGTVILLFAILSTFCFFGQKATYSDSERRPLTDFPDLSAKTLLSGTFMDEFETYAADTFPLREAFRGIKSTTTLFALGQKTNNDLYISQGYLAALEYPMDDSKIRHATDLFGSIYESTIAGTDAAVYISVIPDKNAYLADSAGQLSMDYTAFEAMVADRTASFATYIPISDLLSLEDFYRTDSHWRQEQISDVADRLVYSMHSGSPVTDAPSLAAYTEVSGAEPFYGVYHGQSALPLKGESLSWLTNAIIEQLSVYDHQNQRPIPVYNIEKTAGKDPYELFLSGPLSLLTIENPEINSQKELVIFRDSYASSLAPLIAQGYKKVTLVDIRYLPASQVSKYVDFSNCDVLFLYSTSVLNNSETLKP